MTVEDEIIKEAGRKFLPPFYDWRFFKAQLWQESRLNALAHSPAGARGVAQIMPKTWNEWSIKAGHEHSDPYDFKASVETGACYLNWIYGQWAMPRQEIDRIALAMASYNAGLGNILTAQRLADNAADYKTIISKLNKVTGDRNSAETLGYAYNIFNKYNEYVLK